MWALHLYSFESQAEVREICIRFLQLGLKELHTGLEEDDALGGPFCARYEQLMDVLDLLDLQRGRCRMGIMLETL